MTGPEWTLRARLDDAGLTLEELCRVCAVSPDWVRQRVHAGLLPPGTPAGDEARFDATLILRVRRMYRVERDFDAVPELAALVADLEDEIERLRRRLLSRGA